MCGVWVVCVGGGARRGKGGKGKGDEYREERRGREDMGRKDMEERTCSVSWYCRKLSLVHASSVQVSV